MTPPSETEKVISRRKLLRVLATTGGIAAAATLLPVKWIRPVTRVEALPPHAQVSAVPTVSPTPTSTPLPMTCPGTGMVANYQFSGAATDMSGHGHDGTVHGAILVSDRYGHLNSAYSFNGSDSYISVLPAADLNDFGQALSIVAWIKITPGANYNVYDYRHILSKGATYGDLWADYAIGLSNPEGALLWEYTNVTNNVIREHTGIPIPQDEWHFVAVTFNAGVVDFYLDGVSQHTYNGPYTSLRSSTQPLYIGARYIVPLVGIFPGSIDDVRLYSCALSAQEIYTMYQQEAVTTLTSKTALALTGSG